MPFTKSLRSNGRCFNIYYEFLDNKSATDVIIFHHGNGNSCQDWKSLGYVDLLAPYFKLILVDSMGYGQSEKSYNPEDYAPDLRAEDALAVLKAVNLQQKAIFFGGSMGGLLGFTLAQDPIKSQYFKAFIINGAMPYHRENRLLWFTSILEKAHQEKNIEYFVTALEVILGAPFPKEVRKSFVMNDLPAMIASNTNPWPGYENTLSNITTPLLLIVGEFDDVLAEVKKCHQEITHSELVILSGKNHAQAYWEANVVVPVIMSYLDQLQIKCT